MNKLRNRQLTPEEAFELEKAVRELLWKGKRKRKPFTLQTLEIAVADGTANILYALGMYHLDE